MEIESEIIKEKKVKKKKKNMLSLDLSHSKIEGNEICNRNRGVNIDVDPLECMRLRHQAKKKTISFSGRIPQERGNLFKTPIKAQGSKNFFFKKFYSDFEIFSFFL